MHGQCEMSYLYQADVHPAYLLGTLTVHEPVAASLPEHRRLL